MIDVEAKPCAPVMVIVADDTIPAAVTTPAEDRPFPDPETVIVAADVIAAEE